MLMLRSWSNTLVSVRQATQRNAGRTTAGIDGEVALTSETRMDLVVQVHHQAGSFQDHMRLRILKARSMKRVAHLVVSVMSRLPIRWIAPTARLPVD